MGEGGGGVGFGGSGKIKNWGGECRDVTPTKSLSQNIRVDVNREVKFL